MWFLLPKGLKVFSYVKFCSGFKNVILTILSWGVIPQFEDYVHSLGVLWHIV